MVALRRWAGAGQERKQVDQSEGYYNCPDVTRWRLGPSLQQRSHRDVGQSEMWRQGQENVLVPRMWKVRESEESRMTPRFLA